MDRKECLQTVKKMLQLAENYNKWDAELNEIKENSDLTIASASGADLTPEQEEGLQRYKSEVIASKEKDYERYHYEYYKNRLEEANKVESFVDFYLEEPPKETPREHKKSEFSAVKRHARNKTFGNIMLWLLSLTPIIFVIINIISAFGVAFLPYDAEIVASYLILPGIIYAVVLFFISRHIFEKIGDCNRDKRYKLDDLTDANKDYKRRMREAGRDYDLMVKNYQQECIDYEKEKADLFARFDAGRQTTIDSIQKKMKDAMAEYAMYVDLVPQKYQSLDALRKIIEILEDMRADSIKEAINVLVSDRNQDALIREQQRKNDIMAAHYAEMEREAARQSDMLESALKEETRHRQNVEDELRRQREAAEDERREQYYRDLRNRF